MKPSNCALDVLWMSYKKKKIESNWETNNLFLGGLKNLMKCNKNWIQPGEMPANLSQEK